MISMCNELALIVSLKFMKLTNSLIANYIFPFKSQAPPLWHWLEYRLEITNFVSMLRGQNVLFLVEEKQELLDLRLSD